MGRLLCVLLAAALLTSPVSASSEEPVTGESAAAYLLENRVEELVTPTLSAVKDDTLPERFDLRDYGYVTPVKLQNPWGTCWGFSAVAAAETSILSEQGMTYEETGLDLSEHHLVWFARTYLEEGAQAGEGVHLLTGRASLDTGGMMFEATSLFACGMGVISESLAPYRGLESETAHALGKNYYYYPEDDWSLPASMKFLQSYELEESSLLPSSAVYTADITIDSSMEEREAGYLGMDMSAVSAMKRELTEGRALSVAFCADSSLPEELNDTTKCVYLNTADNHWTHYTYDGGVPNHAVTIVGWDDTVKAADFLDHSNDPYGDGLSHQPEGDGAWIVKNSWGAETSDFPNGGSWGIRNEDGEATGYFYISYYDRSLCYAESFDFDVTGTQTAGGYMIDQYDYMPCETARGWLDTRELSMANVFTAGEDVLLRALSCETSRENTRVRFYVYMLREDAVTPTEGELLASAEAVCPYAGYHRLSLSEAVFIPKGGSYAVVVTQTVEGEGAVYYGISLATAMNEEGVTEWNRREYNHNRGLSESEMNLKDFYCVGVVNPGESFVYIGGLGQWFDLADVVPSLCAHEEYRLLSMDNFPIKAYSELADPNLAEAMAEESTPELPSFAEPAGEVYVPFVLFCAGCGVLIAGGVFLHVRRHIRVKRRLARYEEELSRLR